MGGDDGQKWTRRNLLLAGAAAAASLIAGPAIARPARSMPDRSLFLKNPHTGEVFRGTFWQKGNYLPGSLRDINRLMRDHHVDEVAEIDRGLIDLLYGIQKRLGAKRPIFVMSGYRSPVTNAALQAEGYHAADNSLHLVGKAADIHVERVRLVDMRKIAVALRAGGVGTYRRGNFLHVDTGRVRVW